MVIPTVDHDCVLKDFVVELANRVAKLEHENAQLKKAHIGPKSEKRKLPRPDPKRAASVEERLATRRARAAVRAEIPTVTVSHRVPDAKRTCPHCGNGNLEPLGAGKTTSVFEFVPARFVQQVHERGGQQRSGGQAEEVLRAETDCACFRAARQSKAHQARCEPDAADARGQRRDQDGDQSHA